jgi:SPP1 gp7 family putative phage head morphogenesis protein
VSELDDAIRATRRRISALEGPERARMLDIYDRAIRNLSADLNLVTQAIAEARDQGFEINPDWLRRQDRYIRLIARAQQEFNQFATTAEQMVEQVRVIAIRGGAAEAWELAEASGIEPGFRSTINTRAVEYAMASTWAGPVREVLSTYGPGATQVISDTLIDGMARGQSPHTIVRRIERELASPVNHGRLEALIRTEAMRGFRAGLNETYNSMAHLIDGYRWVAAKSLRTCLACLGMDGRIQKEPWDRMHVSCRCISTPVPKGTLLPYETGDQWLRRQSPQRQRRMFPSEDAYNAYRGRWVRLRDFVGVTDDRVWGQAIYQKSGRQVMEDRA